MSRCWRIVVLAAFVLVVACAESMAGLDVTGRTTVTNPAPDYKDYFGESVARLGSDRFLVGCPHEYSSSTSLPTVHLYDENGVQLLAVTNPAAAEDDHFGHAVSGVGNERFAVGAYGAEAAYLFNTNGTLLATVTNPAPLGGGSFGMAVAGLGSDRFLVGASGANEVYLYDLAGELLATVTNPCATGADGFGYVLAELEAGGFVAGAYLADDGSVTNAGAVYVYDSACALLAVVTNPTPELNDWFGSAVCGLGPDHFAVGARNDNTTTTNAGSVYVYDLSGQLVVSITNPVPGVSDNFGSSISEVGDERLLVGVPDGASYRTGCAWVYSLSGNLLAGVTNPVGGWDEHFGAAVASVGTNKFVVGVPQCLSGGGGIYHKSGRVQVYTFDDGREFFVNDSATAGDAWCSAVGSDLNAGTNPAAPKATVQGVLSSYTLEPRDTIYVDTGDYLLTNTIEITGVDEVSLRGSPSGTVFGCSSSNVTALLLNTAACTRVSSLAITGGYSAIALRYSDHCEIGNVQISGTADNGVRTTFSDGNTFERLEITECGGAGVYWAVESDNNLLANSVLWSNGVHGVRSEGSFGVGYTRSNLVARCTLAFNGSYQVYVANSSWVEMRDSIAVAAGAGNCCVYQKSTYKGGGGSYRGDYNNLQAIDGACVGAYDTWDPPPPFVNPTYYTNLSDWHAVNKDTNSLSEDPLFVDAGSDFHLRSTQTSGTYVEATGAWTNFASHSPSINAGDPATAWSAEPAPNGARVNMGAYGDSSEASRGGGWVYYVNDASTLDDVWCTAAGDDAHMGTDRAAPKASLRSLLSTHDLEPEDVVYVDTGIHTLTNALTISNNHSGAGSAFVHFKGAGAGTVIVGPTGTSQATFTVMGTNVIVSHMLLTNCSVQVDGSPIHLRDLEIRNAPGFGVQGPRWWRSGYLCASNVLIRNAAKSGYYFYGEGRVVGSEVTGCGENGILVAQEKPVHLLNCLVWSNAREGVRCYSPGYEPMHPTLVEACTIAYNASNQVGVYDSGFPTYQGGEVHVTNSIIVASGAGTKCVNTDFGTCLEAFNNFHANNGATIGRNIDDFSISADPQFADWSAGDFHLKSQAGRWDPSSGWVTDATHSVCIDAGLFGSAWDREPVPNGERVNLGRYANTDEASRGQTNAWVVAVSLNDGGTVSGTQDLVWASGYLVTTSEHVRLEYSPDAGATWEVIVSNLVLDAGSSSWDTTRQPSSGAALWRVVVESDPAILDPANEPFILRNQALTYYVNDASQVGDIWCGAAGTESGSGATADDPKDSLWALLNTYSLEPGDTVYMDTGTYSATNEARFDSGDSGSAVYGYVRLVGNTGSTVMVCSPDGFVHGIHLNPAAYVEVSGLTISNAHTGVRLYNADHCIVRNVDVREATVGIDLQYSDDNIVETCDVRDGQEGVRVYDSDENAFANCVVCSNSGDGFHVMQNSSNTTVESCTVAFNGYQQFDITKGTTSLELNNSIVVASGAGNCCLYQYDDGTGPGLYLGDYNILFAVNSGSLGGSRVPAGSTDYFNTLAQWQSHSTQDAHSINSDPLFVDNAGDLHLRSSAPGGTYVVAAGGWTNFAGDNSPGIDNGDPGSDYSNEPDWNGGIVNAGAYGNTPQASRSADADGDALSDSLETYRIGSSAVLLDTDGDGMGDRYEVVAGTDAASTGSVFAATCAGGTLASGEELVITWPSAEGREYRVERADTLESGFSPLASGITATPPMNSWTTSVTGLDQAVYKVHVSR